MSQLTYFPFYVEGGFKGNLAKAPEFGETSKGQYFAKIALYTKAADNSDSSVKNLKEERPTLMTYVRFYDDNVVEAIEELNKGDFINVVGFSMLNIGRGIDEETGELTTCLFVKAKDYKILSKATSKERPAASKTTKPRRANKTTRRASA